ncbi:hypothetical protein [Cyanobium sp. Tous-M-B4]|uniref:hypothetical protein n=1 Tax=Cyanobium sp. Tous-M-B4 TaxID=2823724 RepID=UPI0020CD6C61|nr:hypothetical protein [Cyanobium sp. Tous-M-B4]MCP9776764.1 hypothetical protein [Cyanobium sp. Tous-M-B4]
MILRLLNLVALADGGVSLEEESLLESLSEQYKLQAKFVTWEDQVSDPACIEELAALINPEQRELAMKTAVMVASASRHQQDDEFICEQEREILSRLATGLELSPDQLQSIESAAAEEIKEHPNLWQVLFSLFGNRFDFPVLG